MVYAVTGATPKTLVFVRRAGGGHREDMIGALYFRRWRTSVMIPDNSLGIFKLRLQISEGREVSL